MLSQSEILKVGVELDTKKFDKGVRHVKQSTADMAEGIGAIADDAMSLGSSLAKNIALPMLALAGVSTKISADFESIAVSFESMLGGKDAAGKMMKDLQQFSSTTPFQFENVAKAGKLLLSFSYASEDVIKNLRMLGDVAAGVDKPLSEIAYVMGKIKTKGKAGLEEINQLAERGIPIFTELGKVLKTNTSGVYEYSRQGKLSFEIVNDAIKNMTSTQGMFFNQTIKQAKTLNGIISTLYDNLKLSLDKLGQELLPTMKILANTLNIILGYVQLIPKPIMYITALVTTLTISITAMGVGLLSTVGIMGFMSKESFNVLKNFKLLKNIVSGGKVFEMLGKNIKVPLEDLLEMRESTLSMAEDLAHATITKFKLNAESGKGLDILNDHRRAWKQMQVYQSGTLKAGVSINNTLKSIKNRYISVVYWVGIKLGLEKKSLIILNAQKKTIQLTISIIKGSTVLITKLVAFALFSYTIISGVRGEWQSLNDIIFMVGQVLYGLIVILQPVAKLFGTLIGGILIGFNEIYHGLQKLTNWGMTLIKGSVEWITNNAGKLWDMLWDRWKVGVNNYIISITKIRDITIAAIKDINKLTKFDFSDAGGTIKKELEMKINYKSFEDKPEFTKFNFDGVPYLNEKIKQTEQTTADMGAFIKKMWKVNPAEDFYKALLVWVKKKKGKGKGKGNDNDKDYGNGFGNGNGNGAMLFKGALDTYQNELKLQRGASEKAKVDNATIETALYTKSINNAVKKILKQNNAIGI